ncbi:MAG TPA: DUF2079 domain-containing protein [Candidatus Dormibacteraeota bacterium]
MDVLTPAAGERAVTRTLPPAALPVAVGGLAAGLFAWSLLRRSDVLLLHAYDSAFFQQVVWNAGHGRGFSSGFFPASLLGLHFEPLLAVPALLELAWPDVTLLGLLQAVALGAAAPAAYLLLDALLPGRRLLAAVLAAPVPLWAEVQQAARADFHTESLALPLVLLAGWAGLRGRTLACWALALAALAAKEDQAYAVAVVGALLLLHGPSRRHGAALVGVAVAWGAAAEWVVMPALRGGVTSQTDSYYRWLHTAGPAQVAGALAVPAGWLAFGGLVAGLAALPLLRPAWLALALPPLVADLLSAHHPQPELRYQYGLPLVVPVLVAAALSARRLPADLPVTAVGLLALPALAVGLATGPIVTERLDAAPALARLRACTAALPPLAAVAADDAIAPALASRPVLRMLADARAGDYVVVDRAGRQPDYVPQPERDRVLAALPAQHRGLLCDDGRFQLWSPAGGTN